MGSSSNTQSSDLFQDGCGRKQFQQTIFKEQNLVLFESITSILKVIGDDPEKHGWIPNHYFEIQRESRMEDVLHMIAYIILQYGKNQAPPWGQTIPQTHPKPNFVFVKVDSLLYQVCLDNNYQAGNLYTRAI